jgi:predicted unusual protein kinase regulating ubiquinone biosynthesis (AarF/ABC1/UbiB family)
LLHSWHRLPVIAGVANQYDVVGLVQEFDQSLRGEIFYLREGHNAERFGNFATESTVQIPRMF